MTDLAVIGGWIMIGFLVLASLMTIAQIGKPRPPLAHGVAILALLFSVLEIAVVYALITR